ncbi:MAG: hypothetical protein IJV01_06410 [Bacteroidales bacterium]|nr:hypothetical protein [Bacteroidales bacterium]
MSTFLTTLFAIAVAALPVDIPFERGDRMPDFSRVGYRWGDVEIPTVKVVKKLKAPKDGSDATALIQDAIDGMKKPGAILLTAGTYNVGGPINIKKSGVVLRGEGQDKTILVCTGTAQRTFINIDSGANRALDEKHRAKVTDAYVPFGALSFNVDNPWQFRVGDRVVVRRPSTKKWLHDIRMDQIPQFFDTYGIVVRQWQPGQVDILFERTISGIEGNTIFLDNPVTYALDAQYGGGEVIRCRFDRLQECGVENLKLVSEFDDSKKSHVTYQGKVEEYFSDEQHGWIAIRFARAEHCWVRNVTTQYFGYSHTAMGIYAKNITVKDCTCLDPVSRLHGSRRYAFATAGCELCLVKDCVMDKDRHGCVTNGRTPGPNVYTRCRVTHAYSDSGPHNRLGICTLYDALYIEGSLDVQDRAGSGHGHGWAGANMVFWNCDCRDIVCQGLWASATNYCIGCTGKKRSGWFGQGSHEEYKGRFVGGLDPGFEERPDGVWVSHGKHVEPESLYDWQYAQRKAAGEKAVPEPCYKSIWNK